MLQQLEIRTPLVIHHDDLAVQDSVSPEFPESLRDRSELLVERYPFRNRAKRPVRDSQCPYRPTSPQRSNPDVERFPGHACEHGAVRRAASLRPECPSIYPFPRFVKTDLVQLFRLNDLEAPASSISSSVLWDTRNGSPEDLLPGSSAVLLLQEQPGSIAVACPYQREHAVQLFSFEDELHITTLSPSRRSFSFSSHPARQGDDKSPVQMMTLRAVIPLRITPRSPCTREGWSSTITASLFAEGSARASHRPALQHSSSSRRRS